jgi:hypothetical protein
MRSRRSPDLKVALRHVGDVPFDVDGLIVSELPPASRDNPYTPDYDAIHLTTIGSREVGIAVTPSPLMENTGGATLWFDLSNGPLAIGLTAAEARDLASWLVDVVDTVSTPKVGTGLERRDS